MGQAYCETCCGGSQIPSINPNVIQQINTDAPDHRFAKPVKNVIEVHPKIRQIYARERNPHIQQRKGTKLSLYYLFEYGAYYNGDWKDGLPHGGGTLIYDDGSIYQGCFREGYAECRRALFIRENGSYFKGEVRKNKAFGEGTFSNDKIQYKGSWDNDLPHGEGRQTYKMTNSYFIGNFIKGHKNGCGRYQWSPHVFYEGEFLNNEIHGTGVHVTREFEYEGEFVKGEKHGRGTMKNMQKGESYEGEFRNNRMEGQGVYRWPDGTSFKGRFENNQKKAGKLILPDGEIIDDNS